jgi:hypothetical protein
MEYNLFMLIIVESETFQRLWPLYWTEDERGAFAAFLAAHPDAGDVIVGTGGLRKVRWTRAGSGKSGGVRVVYFSRNAAGELVLLTMYSKSKANSIPVKQLLEIKHANTL